MLAWTQTLPARAPNDATLVDQLAAHHLLDVVPRPDLERLAADVVERVYRKGHRFYFAGDPPTYVFIVKSGLVALTDQDDRGHVYATMTYSPGDVLGVAATVLNIPHTVTPIAMVDTAALLLNAASFNALYHRLPALAHKVVRELHEILRRAEKATISFARTHVPGRVAALLLESSAKVSGSPEDEVEIELTFSHQELAILLGTTRETITRVLARMSRTGVIAIQGRRVRIVRPDWLRRLAEHE